MMAKIVSVTISRPLHPITLSWVIVVTAPATAKRSMALLNPAHRGHSGGTPKSRKSRAPRCKKSTENIAQRKWSMLILYGIFLAATKQLYKWYFPSVCPSVRLSVCPSVRLSVCLSHLFDYVPIIVSSWNFQELLPMTDVRSMQKVKVRGQRSRSQRSRPILTVSGL